MKTTTKWKDEYIDLIYQHMADGGKISTFARRIGVQWKTVKRWLCEKEDFHNAKEAGKSALIEKAQKSLLNRALGMSVPEVKVAYDKDLKEFASIEIEKHLPPDPAAAIKLLETLTQSIKEKQEDDLWSKSTTINHESQDGSMTPQTVQTIDPEMIKEISEKLKDEF
jgi:hypothetical protein